MKLVISIVFFLFMIILGLGLMLFGFIMDKNGDEISDWLTSKITKRKNKKDNDDDYKKK